jgi:hypothetical protein
VIVTSLRSVVCTLYIPTAILSAGEYFYRGNQINSINVLFYCLQQKFIVKFLNVFYIRGYPVMILIMGAMLTREPN